MRQFRSAGDLTSATGQNDPSAGDPIESGPHQSLPHAGKNLLEPRPDNPRQFGARQPQIAVLPVTAFADLQDVDRLPTVRCYGRGAAMKGLKALCLVERRQ